MTQYYIWYSAAGGNKDSCTVEYCGDQSSLAEFMRASTHSILLERGVPVNDVNVSGWFKC